MLSGRHILPCCVALAMLAGLSGCGMFRCKTTSDETLAAARQLSLQGLEAEQQGRWDQAESMFAAACQQAPQDERAHCGYAEALWRRGAHDEAIGHMEQAVRLSGNDPERMIQLGEMYRVRGEPERAGEQAARAIAANSQLAGAWALRGRVLEAQGLRSDAMASFHRALSLEPRLPDVQLALARIYAHQNRPQQALAMLHTLSDSYPPGEIPVEVLVEQSLALRQLGRLHDAAVCLAQATTMPSANADLFYELARTQALSGDVVSARLSLESALARDPQHALSLAMREELAARQGSLAALNSR